MRGEHAPPVCQRRPDDGSSPHARGTPPVIENCGVQSRFIPACAGNTQVTRLISLAPAVHPRMRGEHQRKNTTHWNSTGSSPHARGTRAITCREPYSGRFIPACAGNTLVRRRSCWLMAVHPRMRGEHEGNEAGRAGLAGSSPHARGTLHIGEEHIMDSRFIPACAGNTVVV